jgi:hypothetical protein
VFLVWTVFGCCRALLGWTDEGVRPYVIRWTDEGVRPYVVLLCNRRVTGLQFLSVHRDDLGHVG